MSILKSDKIDVRAKDIPRKVKHHFIMVKESIHQENMSILNVCALKPELYNTWNKNRTVGERDWASIFDKISRQKKISVRILEP